MDNEIEQNGQITVAADKELAKAGEKADVKTQLEEQSLRLARAEAELKEAHVRSAKQDIEERKLYAGHIFKLICAWVAAVLLLLILSGFSQHMGFSLPTPVLLATIGSLTLNVLGLFYIVAHYLFPARERHHAPKPGPDAPQDK